MGPDIRHVPAGLVIKVPLIVIRESNTEAMVPGQLCRPSLYSSYSDAASLRLVYCS